jgi:hypothetical protein
MSLKLSESLRDWLVTFDYDVIEQEKPDEIGKKLAIKLLPH